MRPSSEGCCHVLELVRLIDRHTFRQRLRWGPSWSIDDAPLLFFDLETTGLYPERGHRIVQVAIFDAGGLRYERGHHCDPMSEQDERAMVEDVAGAVAHKIVVGHNIPFDLRFLAERSRRLEVPLPSVGFIDTLGMARRFLSDADEELTLEYVARRLELDIPDQLHRAAPDARLARDVFRTIADAQQFETLEDVRVRRFEVHEH